jgi:hypothetical protein
MSPSPANHLRETLMNYELKLDFLDVREGLKKFKIPRKIRASAQAMLAFDGKFCSIEAFDVLIVARANGIWPGIARFSATAIAALAKFPPDSDPFVIRIAENKLSLGPVNIACEWQPVSHTLMNLPAAPDWIEALSLKYRASRSQILSAKANKTIAQAERKLEILIAKVGKSLQPLGVTKSDIKALIEMRLVERYVRNGNAS